MINDYVPHLTDDYSFWTMDGYTSEMGERIDHGEFTLGDAMDIAQRAANDRDRPILVLRNGDQFDTVYPDPGF